MLGSKRAATGIVGEENANCVPKSMEINVDIAEGEDEFMEITTRRKSYLEVARDAVYNNRSSPYMSSDGKTPVVSIVTTKKANRSCKRKSASRRAEDELNSSGQLEDLDGVNYDLKKSNRHLLKLKNKKTPTYYKELKLRNAHLKKNFK